MLQKGLMDRNPILQLGLEELHRQEAAIEAEMEQIQAELRIAGSAAGQTGPVSSAGRPRTMA